MSHRKGQRSYLGDVTRKLKTKDKNLLAGGGEEAGERCAMPDWTKHRGKYLYT